MGIGNDFWAAAGYGGSPYLVSEPLVYRGPTGRTSMLVSSGQELLPLGISAGWIALGEDESVDCVIVWFDADTCDSCLLSSVSNASHTFSVQDSEA